MTEQEVIDRFNTRFYHEAESWGAERMAPTRDFVFERAKQWSGVIGIPYYEIINKWLDLCNYSMINYFQNANQPKLDENAHIFETIEDWKKSVGDKGFRCPCCNGISSDPYECNSGVLINRIGSRKNSKKLPCNWKVFGIFRDLGKGAFVFLKDGMHYSQVFMPVAWEDKNND